MGPADGRRSSSGDQLEVAKYQAIPVRQAWLALTKEGLDPLLEEEGAANDVLERLRRAISNHSLL